ncbi:MAG: hypothetical protein ABIZ91_08735 [Gemmatimonadaceae bacterium]
MARLSPDEYNALEAAITHRQRLAVVRRGTEYLLTPSRLFMQGGREAIEARHPTTGDRMVLVIDELDSIDVMR